MKYNKIFLFCLLLSLSVFVVPHIAWAVNGPKAYLTESVDAHYFWNGTVDGIVSRTGILEVSVPNTEDVLQDVHVNVSATTDTDLQIVRSYRNVVSSPTADSRTQLYVNTTTTPQDTQYAISNSSLAPSFLPSVTIVNSRGGSDLFDADNIDSSTNTMNFTISIQNPSDIKPLNEVVINITFGTDTNGTADSVNIITTPTSVGGTEVSIGKTDSDSDSYYDKVFWTGDIGAGQTLNITFNVTIEEDINYLGDSFSGTESLNLNGESSTIGTRIEYDNTTNVLSTLTLAAKFTRGPVRQGIDMVIDPSDSTWLVRGFFENIANSSVGTTLTYAVHEWRLYEVNNSTGVPFGSAAAQYSGGGDWAPNFLTSTPRKYTNPWFDTDGTSKPYYASYFDWEVQWDTTWQNYYATINTTMALQTLYEIDAANIKSIDGILPAETENSTLVINDSVSHVGHSNLKGDYIEIISIIPNTNDAGSARLFEINDSSLKVYFNNGTDYELTQSGAVSTSIVQPTESVNGSVTVTISDLASAGLVAGGTVGEDLQQNEKIRIAFDVLSNSSMIAGDEFTFRGNSTLKTQSGTPISELHPTESINVSRKRLQAYKELFAEDASNPTLINATILISAIDKSIAQDGISGIKITDYVPNGTDFSTSNVTVQFYNTTDWITWAEEVEYNITDQGEITLSDGIVVRGYEYYNSSDATGWTLYDGEKIRIDYPVNITTEGVYFLPAQLIALDPSTGADLSASTVGVIKVSVPQKMTPPVINEGEFDIGKFVTVGKPVTWVKQFEVYNPNMYVLSSEFESEIFSDSLSAIISYQESDGSELSERAVIRERDGRKFVVWSTKLAPFESRVYTIKTLTPQVLVVDSEIVVKDKLSDDLIALKYIFHLKNLAEEDYSNVQLYLPLSKDKIIRVIDGNGNELGLLDSTGAIVNILEMRAQSIMTIEVLFRESYPLLIVSTNKDLYTPDSEVGLSVQIINGGEKVGKPYLETEVYTPSMDVLYTNMEDLNNPIEPLQSLRYSDKFMLPKSSPTGAYLASVRFREDFNTISTGDASFKVSGGSEGLNVGLYLFLFVALLAVASIVWKLRGGLKV